MRSKRREMTARIVPLNSDSAGDGRVGGSAAERLLLLAELSRRAWGLTKKPLPSYTRQNMPVVLSRLSDQ